MKNTYVKICILLYILLYSIASFANNGNENILLVLDKTAKPGDNVTLELEMINDDVIVSFQATIMLPEGFGYVAGSGQLHRKNGHDLFANYNEATNELVLLAFAFSGAPFTGNDGVLFSAELTTPETPGIFEVSLTEVLLVKQGAIDVTTGFFPGTITLQYILTINTEGQGHVAVNGEAYETPVAITDTDPVTLTAIPETGWQFSHWSGDLTGGDPEVSIPITQDTNITAHFTVKTYNLVYIAGENGSLLGNTEQLVEHGSDGTPVEAVPDDGFFFAGWSDGVTDNPRTDLNVTDNLEVTALFTGAEYTITATAGDGGTIDPAGTITVTHGAELTFTITPDADDGFEVADVLVDGESIGPVTSYTFQNIASDHTIEALFALRQYIITATAEEGGTIDPDGDVPVTHGENQLFTITPDTENGYELTDVLVNGVSVGAITSFAFENVVEDHTIQAFFELREYTITATAGEGGAIDPAGTVTVTHGTDQTFEIIPDAEGGYEVADVLVDGTSVGAVTSYTFTNVTTNHTIEAQFQLRTYTIVSTATPGGTIDPAGDIFVTHGDSQTFTIAADTEAGYEIADVLVDGESVGAVESYTFENVTSNHTIEAQFSAGQYIITATAGEGGTIDPAGEVVVEHGSSQTFTIIPDDENGYEVADVIVNGQSVGAVESYTFENITFDGQTIEALFALRQYTVTAIAGEGGTIDPVGTVNVTHGDNLSFTITPDTASDFVIADVLVDGNSVGPLTSFTFENISADHSIEALFALREFIITATAGPGGTIDPIGEIPVTAGENQTFIITADETLGFAIDDVIVDGQSQGPVESYTFENVNDDHTIEAVFVQLQFVITATAGEGGTINPEGNVIMTPGDSQMFTITPDEEAGYEIADVIVDGVSVGAVQSYTFDNVITNHTIEAQFQPRTYIITATAGVGGTINPAGDVPVLHGQNQAFTITPATGYTVANVIVDGESKGAITSFTFVNVTANHTIEAQFQLRQYAIVASASAGGTIQPSGVIIVNHGTDRTFTITPNNAAGYDIDDVLVDGTSIGPTTSYTFTNISANHTIQAFFLLRTYQLLYAAGPNGSITGQTEQFVQHGNDGTPVEAIPDEGYQFVEWSDGVTQNPRTDTQVTSDLDVTAIFELAVYTIQATASDGGTIDPSGEVMVMHGQNQTFNITPDTEAFYEIADVLVDGVSIGPAESYTFVNVTTNHTIEAQFERPGLLLNYFTGANGSLSGETQQIVPFGEDGSPVEAVPDEGYHFLIWSDGVTANPRTDNNVTAPVQATAIFSINIYTLNATANKGGTIDPEGMFDVEHGETRSFSIQADNDAGYTLNNVFVDGNGIGPVADYTFENISQNHTIHAQFSFNNIGMNVLQLLPAIGQTGSKMVVELEAVNDNTFNAFTAQISLPDGFVFESLNLNSIRTTDHQAEANITAGNILNIHAFSPTGQLFTGNDGAIAYIRVKAADTPGQYPLPLMTGSMFTVFDDNLEPMLTDGMVSTSDHINLVFPGITFPGWVETCFDAVKTITLAGQNKEFVVKEGASVTLIAGEKIRMLPGTRIEEGSYFNARISETGEFCDLPPLLADEFIHEDEEGQSPDGQIMPTEPEKMTFELYPNPTTGHFTIAMAGFYADDPVRVEVVSLNGHIVISTLVTAQPAITLNLTDQQPGIYFVRVKQGSNLTVKRLIKY